jgi:preprotein translocase subunit SecF
MGVQQQFSDLYHERTNYQFIKGSWKWAIVSGFLIAISLISFGVRGLNQSIEFTGGTSFETVVNGKSPDPADVREVMADAGVEEVKVQIINDDSIRVTSEQLDRATQAKVIKGLSDYANVDPRDISISDVGPSWGKEVSKKALTALIVFFFVVAIYMIFRFEMAMAAAAIIAVIHDVIITVGFYSITQLVVSPATVVAFLTILGFSLYDTVVVFDKIRDNTKIWEKLKQESYAEMVNRSLNQVLMRSINTSIVAVLPVLSLILVGSFLLNAVALLDFAVALAVGLATGAYSSIFVATPLIVAIKRWTNKADNM